LAKVVTSNEVFDYIADFSTGSVILVLDETRFESTLFLNSLLSPSKSDVFLISPWQLESPFKALKITPDNLVDLNTANHFVEEVRAKAGAGSVLVHEYLPHLLVRQNEDDVLRMVEFWIGRVTQFDTLELITLPEGTFPSFEKKLQALVHGTLRIKLRRDEKETSLSLSLANVCKPEYHLKEIPFRIQDGRLLVRWGDAFTDHLPKQSGVEVEERIRYLRSNLTNLRISAGEADTTRLDQYEYWLVSQLVGKRVADLQLLFPDRFEQMLRLLAKMSLSDYLRIQHSTGDELQLNPSRDESIRITTPESPPKPGLSLRSKLAMILPMRLSLWMLQRSGHYMTADTYYSYKKSVESFLAYVMGQEMLTEKLEDVEKLFQEITARHISLERILRNKEDPRIAFDLKYLPRCIVLTLYAGFHRTARVKREGDRFRVTIRDCPVCAHQTRDKPTCGIIAATIVGMCGVCFKQEFSCHEVSCAAMGQPNCEFLVYRKAPLLSK